MVITYDIHGTVNGSEISMLSDDRLMGTFRKSSREWFFWPCSHQEPWDEIVLKAMISKLNELNYKP